MHCWSSFSLSDSDPSLPPFLPSSRRNQSPISRQARSGQQPDGICIVVGTMASGFAPENNTYADLLYSNTPTMDKGRSQVHWFWEAFPASSGKDDRTTYLFMYCDAKPERPSILECFEVR